MTKAELQELLRRYRAGICSPEEIQRVKDWFDSIGDENLELSEVEKMEVKEEILAAIRKTQGTSTEPRKSRSLIFPIAKAAASIALIVVGGYIAVTRYWIRSVPSPISEVKASFNSIEHRNTSTEILRLQLPDLSTVELKPNAEISYSANWNDSKREVQLVGEAFFEVVKDPKRPFYVYGGKIVTKVLGTSFSVKATMDAESIEVSVRTGKVSVYEDGAGSIDHHRGNDANGVILTPNEKVEYFVNNKHWVTSLVARPQPLPSSNKELEFIFSDTPMSEIISSIERTYSIDIILENEASNACTFTGDVSAMELYDLLEVICKSTGAEYEVKGTKILVTGRGCQ
jgi:ferric-dicitrate binding protein FerR (iron transport regulator)